MVAAFTLLGLAIAAGSYAYALSVSDIDPFKGPPALLTISWILCPPQLLFGWDGFIMSSIIGVSNAALYALIGFIIVIWKKEKPSNSLKIDD
jgi:hypothetical protein